MKAAIIREHGELDRIKVEDIAEPVAGESQVVIEVRSAALNHLDIWVRKGRPGLELKMPHVLGSDASGVVVDTGRDTHGVALGEEVILNPGLHCGCCEYCFRGEHSLCSRFGIIGLSRPGTFAEKVAVPFYCVRPKPDYLDFDEAAALPLAYMTAWRMLMTRCRLQAGDTVLIHGIGGGVALAAMQLAKLAGAQVIATSSSDGKLSKAKEIGADFTINYTAVDNIAKYVRDITGGRGVDIAFDTVGAATWPVDFDAVRRGGKIVICGVTTGAAAETNLHSLYWNQLTVMGSTMGSNEDFRRMVRAVSTAKLKPVIDSVLGLDDAGEATARMEAGDQFGKIVLKMTE